MAREPGGIAFWASLAHSFCHEHSLRKYSRRFTFSQATALRRRDTNSTRSPQYVSAVSSSLARRSLQRISIGFKSCEHFWVVFMNCHPVCACVCACVCVYVNVCICACAYVYVCVFVCVYVCMYACMCLYVCMCVRVYVPLCVYAYELCSIYGSEINRSHDSEVQRPSTKLTSVTAVMSIVTNSVVTLTMSFPFRHDRILPRQVWMRYVHTCSFVSMV